MAARIRSSILTASAFVACFLAAPGARAQEPVVPAPEDTAAAAVALTDSVLEAAAVPEGMLDLNRATLDEIRALPVSEEIALAIYEHRMYRAFFRSVYDLLLVEGVTPEILLTLKPLVAITPEFEILEEELREEEKRAQERNFVLQRMLSDEGANEGLIDSYIDQLREPRNVNDLTFYDLISYQNVSPVDALAIIKEREQSGKIENERQLRDSENLGYYGFRNLRDFIRYEGRSDKIRVAGDYQFRLYNTPYLVDDADILNESIAGAETNYDLNTYAGRLNINSADPYSTHKIRLRMGRHMTGGYIAHRNLGEDDFDQTNKWFLEVKDLPARETALGTLRLNSAAIGNFAVTFGQGLLLDATDFFSARKTGYGFSPRVIGLRGDLSRSHEYTMRGGGVDATLGKVRGTFFLSKDDKDAILNPDGSFNSYFAAIPRVSNEELAAIQKDIEDGLLPGPNGTDPFLPMRDVMEEKIVGGNLKFEFMPGTYVGVTGTEWKYKNNVFKTEGADRWNPDPTTLVIDPGRLEDRDSEIAARYNSVNLGNYRRIWGAEAQTVFKNVSLAGEYGKLETSAASGTVDRIFSNGPEAYIANAYVQYDNFHALVLYRNYDIGYDNPYSRSFSEDAKYEMTLLDGNPFRLKNPYWAYLGTQSTGSNAQPKAEEGWFFATRYQPTRQFLITGLEYDTWKRQAEAAELRRMTLRLEYRPVFPVRLLGRHRISSRDQYDPQDVRRFVSWDTRLEMRVNLSDFDQVEFLYSTTHVAFTGRGRLNGPASGGDVQEDSTATAGIPGKALQANLTHNFGDFLTLTLSTEMYDGFLWNFEDNEFIVVDGEGFRNWILVRSRLSEHLGWRFKWTTDHQRPRTYVDIRNFGSLVPPTPDASNAREDRSSYRFQLDFSF